MRLHFACRLAVVCCLTASAPVSAQSFTPIPEARFGTGVSANGRVAVGYGTPNGTGFRWENGVLTNLPGGDVTQAFGVSGDGQVAVGRVVDPDLLDSYPARWSGSSVQALPTPLGSGTAYKTSETGQVTVGVVQTTSNGLFGPTRWVGTSQQSLPLLAGDNIGEALDVSRDGSVIVGTSYQFTGLPAPNTETPERAVRWLNGTIESLHPSGWERSSAVAVSADGSTVVGWATRPSTERMIWIWRDGTRTDLVRPEGWSSTAFERLSVSGDGSVIVSTTGSPEPFAWTETTGWLPIQDILTGSGVDLQGYRLLSVASISDDGTTVTGRASRTAGEEVAYRASIEPVFEIVAPALDEIVRPGETYTVRFTAPMISTVDLYLVTNSREADGDRILIAEDIPTASGTYEWEVPGGDDDPLSPSTYLIAVDANNLDREVPSNRFRVREPWQLHRLVGTAEQPRYEAFRFSRNVFAFDQRPSTLWPEAYWNRPENAYDNNAIGYDPLISPIGEVRYDEEWFYSRNAEAHPTWESFGRAFGYEGTYASLDPTTDAFGIPIHQINPDAAFRWNLFTGGGDWLNEGAGYGGACYGFALAVIGAFAAPDEFGSRWLPSTGAQYLADLTATDEVRDAIHSLYSYQLDRRAKRRRELTTVTDPVSPRAILDELKAQFEDDDRSQDRVMGFTGPVEEAGGSIGYGGHAVAPVALYDLLDFGDGTTVGEDDDGIYYTVVVDPNYGNELMMVTIDSTAATWQHSFLDGSFAGWFGPVADEGSLILLGFAENTLQPALADWPAVFDLSEPRRTDPPMGTNRQGTDLLTVRVVGGDSGLTGSSGEVSYRNDVLTETLPGARAFFPFTGRASRPEAYVVPPGRYTVDLAPGAEGTSAVEVGDRLALTAERIGGSPARPPDALTVGGDTLRVAAGSEGWLRLRARTTASETVRTFAADSISATAGLAVGVSALADSSGFGVGAEADVVYDLILGTAGPDGRRTFYHANVPLPAGTSHVVQPDWDTLGDVPVTVFVDTNGDGTPDATFDVENEGFPVAREDDQPPSLAPVALEVAPNPSRGATTVHLTLSVAEAVRLEVFDALGRRVLLHEGGFAGGVRSFELPPLAAGVYVARVQTEQAAAVQRFTVVH
ncbi:MAG: T9SS type A sorting domain-containing protein [Bacteroidota bacterium]